MRSLLAVVLFSNLLQRWLKTVDLQADMSHVPIKLVPKVRLPNQMAQQKDNTW